ncbi:MAG: hypothetical protein COA42_12165 [Alteromonadaceae bacterium]|nr:MAG: hypothetical protein COA42_12165 [Alteromonadaceae bacterium]
MNIFRIFIFVFTATLYSSAFAGGIEEQLTGNIWKMERNTGLGKVKTVYMFLSDGSGTGYQQISGRGPTRVENYKFTYKVNQGRIIIQEEIAKGWEGHFGVTRWKLIDNKLVGDVKFRQEVITFSPINL